MAVGGRSRCGGGPQRSPGDRRAAEALGEELTCEEDRPDVRRPAQSVDECERRVQKELSACAAEPRTSEAALNVPAAANEHGLITEHSHNVSSYLTRVSIHGSRPKA